MKLAINEESVDALRDYANNIENVCDCLEEDVLKLYKMFLQVREDIGPHNREFDEMLEHIKTFNDTSKDSILELSYMLKCTADRMESYIRHGSSHGTVNFGNTDITVRYHNEADKRLAKEGTNPVAAELYDEYKSKIKIVDYEHKGTAFYNSLSGSIKLNAMADLHNSTGSISTYYHEVGHMLDHLAGKENLWLSSDCEFRELLEDDVSNYVNKMMIEKKCDLDEAYDIISEEISGDWRSGVSDIFGSVTQCMCQGDWGHHITYWRADPSRIEKEAFANMFEASIGDENKRKDMMHFFPNAYQKFEEIIRSR